MPFLRRLIALLLMVTLPAYAWAALGLPDVCPMQGMDQVELADSGHDCCDPTDGEHGQPNKRHPCKTGQECKTGNLHRWAFASIAQVIVAAEPIVSAAESPLLSQDPTGVWRPPALS